MKILIIVDVQNDFCPGGSLAVDKGSKIIPVINKLTREGDFDLIVATQDWHPLSHVSFASSHVVEPFVTFNGDTVWPDHCVANTEGAMFHVDLEQDKIDMIVRKGMDKDVDAYSPIFDANRNFATPLVQYLDNVTDHKTEFYVCGIATDVCVLNTVLDLNNRYKEHKKSIDIKLIENACAGVTLEGTKDAIKKMKDKGVEIISSKDLI